MAKITDSPYMFFNTTNTWRDTFTYDLYTTETYTNNTISLGPHQGVVVPRETLPKPEPAPKSFNDMLKERAA